MKKVFLYILFLLVFRQGMFGQFNDAQLWQNIYLEKNITPKWIARMNEEGRFSDNMTKPGYFYLDLGVNYKFNKHFHFSLAYVGVQKQRLNKSWSTRHQAYFDITFRQKMGSFMLNDRQMIQWQVQDINTSATGRYPQYYLRNKLTLKYEENFRFQPYLAEEVYYYMNEVYTYWPYKFNRIRYFAGIYYHPNLINEFEVYYLIEKHFNENNPQTNYVIGLGYAHTF